MEHKTNCPKVGDVCLKDCLHSCTCSNSPEIPDSSPSPESVGWEKRWKEKFEGASDGADGMMFDDMRTFLRQEIQSAFEAGKKAGIEEVEKKVRGFIWKTKPIHGTCCTCQTCGAPNDDTDCACERNELFEKTADAITNLLK